MPRPPPSEDVFEGEDDNSDDEYQLYDYQRIVENFSEIHAYQIRYSHDDDEYTDPGCRRDLRDQYVHIKTQCDIVEHREQYIVQQEAPAGHEPYVGDEASLGVSVILRRPEKRVYVTDGFIYILLFLCDVGKVFNDCRAFFGWIPIRML